MATLSLPDAGTACVDGLEVVALDELQTRQENRRMLGGSPA